MMYGVSILLMLFSSTFFINNCTPQVSLKNIEFPPKFEPSSDPDVRTGHLKPFGYQRPPNGPLLEYDKPLRPEKFWEDHVSRNVSLVFRGGISESPAITKWTDTYLRDKYGDLDVLVERKKENRTHGITSRLLLGDFIDRYKKEDIYVVTVMPDPMREEVQVVPSLLCGTFVDFLHETNFWMGSGGTRSVIHYDADHNIHCMVAGRKDFIMINQKYRKELKLTKFPQFGSGFSMVNPDVINLDEYPNMPDVQWTYTTIKAGDCIYIPSGYIHQVRSYDRTISATMLFTAAANNTFEPTGCGNATFDYTPMSKVNVHWTYKKGDKIIEMGFMNIEKFRHLLIDQIKENEHQRFTPQIFEEFIENAFELDDDEKSLQLNPQEVFNTYLDSDGKGYITEEDVKMLSRENLKMVTLHSEAPHGPSEVADELENEILANGKEKEGKEEVEKNERDEKREEPGNDKVEGVREEPDSKIEKYEGKENERDEL